MKIFIDTAQIEEIREALALGIIDGVTTNPSLIAKTGKPFDRVVREICEMVDGPISLEAVSQTGPEILAEARKLSAIAENVVVKIPIMGEGLKATHICAQEGIKTNVTLIFNPLQAMFAAKAGATYVSPFVGRLDDIASEGMEVVGQILEIYNNYGFDTEVIVASIRNPLHVLAAARMGADVATIPYAVLKQLLKHPLTDIGIENFLKDWQKVEAKK